MPPEFSPTQVRPQKKTRQPRKRTRSSKGSPLAAKVSTPMRKGRKKARQVSTKSKRGAGKENIPSATTPKTTPQKTTTAGTGEALTTPNVTPQIRIEPDTHTSAAQDPRFREHMRKAYQHVQSSLPASPFRRPQTQPRRQRPIRPPAMPALAPQPPPRQIIEQPDPDMPRGGALRPKHINMGPYSVPMDNLSQTQADIHTRLMNLQEKASATASYNDLVLNSNLKKLRGVMGPWSQRLAPAKAFRSENFLYTGVDNKENLNGDHRSIGRPTRHFKITSTKPVSTDPLNERDPDFQVYNPAITRLPGNSFFLKLSF